LKTRSGIGELLTDQKDPNSRKTDDDKEKAEIMAEFFQSVFTKEPNDKAPTLPLKETNFKMIEMKITEDEIAKILKKLKIDKSPAPDKIHPRVLKEIVDTIAIPFKIRFELSLKDNEVPKNWKEAQISAIFKLEAQVSLYR
jgi:signal recognition particle subunit SEC65